MKNLPSFLLVSFIAFGMFCSSAELKPVDGFIPIDGKQHFPIGFYELPDDDAKLKEMAEAGVNLIRCRTRDDVERVGSLGMKAVMPLPFQNGVTDKMKQRIDSLIDHPAIVVWEGPDEIAWNFTAASRLFRVHKIHKISGAWWKQTPNAVQYAEEQANKIIPAMRETVEYIRSHDPLHRPFWINEALQSDLYYVRQYLDYIDITGCDIYPVKKEDRRIHRMASATERWKEVGQGRPVWMVLQAFAWSELGDYYGIKELAYPTFTESRFMAYDVITHGAKGILYWGSHYLKSEDFRQSIYALTSELSALQPFLTAAEEKGTQLSLIEIPPEENPTRGVQYTVRRSGNEWLIILVNEDNFRHMGVELSGLKELNGKKMVQLYGDEHTTVNDGNFITRMMPYEVKVFATSKKWESYRKTGRDFIE